MIPRKLLTTLLALAVLLPVLCVVLAGIGPLLGAMEDATGASMVQGFSRAMAVLWALDLVVLLLALAVQSLDRRPTDGE